MPDYLGPDPQTGLMPPRYPPSPGPDFEAIYAYAKQWLDLGDEIYQYYVHLAVPALSVTWSGAAQAKAMESLEPLRRLLVDPAQDSSGKSFLSAARIVWNIGESINWYAEKLQEQRKKEEAQALKEMFLGIFMFALIFVAFVPALGFIANLMATFTRLLTAVVRMFEGAVWMQRMAGFVGGAIDGALGAYVSDKVFNELSGKIAGTHLEEDPKNTIINVGVGAGLGGLFGLAAVGRNVPHDVPNGVGVRGGFGVGASGPKGVGSGVTKTPDFGTGSPNVGFPRNNLFSGPKVEGHGPLTVRDADSIILGSAPPHTAGSPQNVRPGGGRLDLEPPPSQSVKPNDATAGHGVPIDNPRTGTPRPEGGGTYGGPTRDTVLLPPRDGQQVPTGVPRNAGEPPQPVRNVGSSDPRFPGTGNTLGGRPGGSSLHPEPTVYEGPLPRAPHEPLPATPSGSKPPETGNAVSAKPDGGSFPGTGNTLGGRPGGSSLHPEPTVYEGPLPRAPHEPLAATPNVPRPSGAGNVLGARPAVSDLHPAPNVRDIPPAGSAARDVPPAGSTVRDTLPAGSTGSRAEVGGAKAGSANSLTAPRDTPAPPTRDLGDRQPSATSNGDGNAVSARSGSGARSGTGQAASNDGRRGTGQRETDGGPVLLPNHVGPPPAAGREVIRIDPDTGARDFVTIAKDPFPSGGRTLGGRPGVSDLHPAPNLAEGPSPRPSQAQGQRASEHGNYEFHEVDPVTGKTTPTGLGRDDVVVSVKPVDRQVLRTDVGTGQRELVTLSRVPGRGNTLGAAPGELRPAPNMQEGFPPRLGHGPEADGGAYRYHEIDPHTGAATPTEVGATERVVRVQPASGFEQGNFVLKGGEKVPVGAPDERVLRYDWGKRQWDVETVPRASAPVEGRPYHAETPPGRTLNESVPESPAGFQVLRRHADGNVDLLTYQRDPVRVANGKTDGFTFQELGTGRTGWHEGEFFGGTPKVERVTTVPNAHRLDGTQVKITETGALVRDPETRLWTPVRGGGGADGPAATPTKANGPSYYRAPLGRDGLDPAAVKGDPLPVIKVRSDGTVETTSFSPSGDNLPRLRMAENGELVNPTPNNIRPDQLSFDPKSGSITYREFKPFESHGSSGGGADGPSGGGPSRGGGLGQRSIGTESQTRTETRTITFTEDRPSPVGGRTHGEGPEQRVPVPKPTEADPVPTSTTGGGLGGGRPETNVGTRSGTSTGTSHVESPSTPTKPDLPPRPTRTEQVDTNAHGASSRPVSSDGRGSEGASARDELGPHDGPTSLLDSLPAENPLRTNRRLADDPRYAAEVLSAARSHPDVVLGRGRSYALIPESDVPRFIENGQVVVRVDTDWLQSMPDGHRLLVFDATFLRVPHGEQTITLVPTDRLQLTSRNHPELVGTRILGGLQFVGPPVPDLMPPTNLTTPPPLTPPPPAPSAAETGAQPRTQTQTSTITSTENRPPLAGRTAEDGLPEAVIRQPDPAESDTIEQPRDVEDGDGPEVAAGGQEPPEGTRAGGTGSPATSVTTPTSTTAPTSTQQQPPPVMPTPAPPVKGNAVPLSGPAEDVSTRSASILDPLLAQDPRTVNRRLANDRPYAADVLRVAWSHPDAVPGRGRSYALLPDSDLPRFIEHGQAVVRVSTDQPQSMPLGYQLLVFDSDFLRLPYGAQTVTLVSAHDMRLQRRVGREAHFAQPPGVNLMPPPAGSAAGSPASPQAPSGPPPSGSPTPDDADTRMLHRIGARVTNEIASSGGGDLLADLFRARFPAGARLPRDAGDGQGAPWRAHSAAEGPGWRRVVSWHDVATVARQAGRGGFALVRLDDASPDAVGLHVGRDGETLWIVQLRPGVAPVYQLFDESQTAGLPDPVRAAAINYCADVQSAA
ncbi:hypothetical protein [Micromonospora sp. NPDC092111]|uniref:hypothetical protein n=1 Tax=Micromonospora sp. NPDC092111 TaxID=3364289 RepID=UPI003822792E